MRPTVLCTEKQKEQKKPHKQTNGLIIQLHGNGQWFKFCPGHVCVNKENFLVLWQQGQAGHWSQNKWAGGDKKSEKLKVRLMLSCIAMLHSWRNTFSAQLLVGTCLHDENQCNPNHTPSAASLRGEQELNYIPGLNLLSPLASSSRMVIKPLKGQNKWVCINTVSYLNGIQYVIYSLWKYNSVWKA